MNMMVSKAGLFFFFFYFKSRFFCVRSHKSSASCGELLSPFQKLGTVDGRWMDDDGRWMDGGWTMDGRWMDASQPNACNYGIDFSFQLQRRQHPSTQHSLEELCFFSFPLPPKIGNVEDGSFEEERRTCA